MSSGRDIGTGPPGGAEAPERTLGGAELAWLAAIPVAALTVLAMWVLGPPLGRLLFPPETLGFWPSTLPYVHPKPTEQARYLIALLGAVLVPLAVLAAPRLRLPRPSFTRTGTLLAQTALVAVLVLGVLTQKPEGLGLGDVSLGVGYFTPSTLAVAGLIALAFVLCLRSPGARSRLARVAALDSPAIRWGAFALAALATVIWLLPAIQLDGTIATASSARYNLSFTFDEGLAVLNGRTPLVDYIAQYGSLWLYPMAIPMHLADGSLGSFTASMAAISAVAMLAVYGVLRRVARSAVVALALFLPFLATSFFIIEGNPITRYSFADYFGVFPMRYAGPYLVAYLLARRLSGARPRAAIWVFLAAGLTVMNNTDFGIPALGATLIACVVAAAGPRTRRWWLELGLEALAGLLAAYALVAIVTLARTGDLPDIALLFRYAQLFALAGYLMLPTPWFGFWVPIYLTFAVALGVAAVRLARGAEDRLMTGMLTWIGIFGLGIGSYYGGRSHPQVLIAMFSAWSLAVALLVLVAVRSAGAGGRRLGPAHVAAFVGFGLMTCSLAQFPTPWGSIDRLASSASKEPFRSRSEVAFVAAHTTPGEPVALLPSLDQRIAREAGVEDVTPYTGSPSMPTRRQFRETIDRLREAGGRTVIISRREALPEMIPALEHFGFRIVATERRHTGTEVPTLGELVVMTRGGSASQARRRGTSLSPASTSRRSGRLPSP